MSTFGFNTGYVEDLYAQYLENPESVSERWREFFADYDPGPTFTAPAALQTPPPQAEAAPAEVPAKPSGDGAATEAPAPKAEPPAPAEKPAGPPPPSGADLKPLRGAAARIVENMEASLEIPTATSARTIPVKLMVENRRLINDHQRSVGGDKVSFTHIIAYALVQALKAVPAMNNAFRRASSGDGAGALERIEPAGINFGLAIDVERKNGQRSLMVPNVPDAGALTFPELLGAYNDIVRRARDGKLEIKDFQGTTVTLTNPGMIGTVMSVPRLMQGQGLILAVGSIGYPPEFLALPPDEVSRLGISRVMTITSTYDHRVIQGAESGEFLAYVSALLTGKHGFYEGIFRDLGLGTPPLTMGHDTTPVLGQTGEVALVKKQARVLQLIRAYRVRGHLMADLNPLGGDLRQHDELDPASYGLTVWDLDRTFYVGGIGTVGGGLGGKEALPLREILDTVWETYTRHIGTEFMHISDPTEKNWLIERIEPQRMRDEVPLDRKKRILEKLNAAEAFERFIHTKYIGHKRFSLEGAETLIPILDQILSDAADQEVGEAVIGMAHRGRLNVLANVMGKPYTAIFGEFEGNLDTGTAHGSGDVKYHLGAHGSHSSPSGQAIDLTLAGNPSHLEAVNPVVEGMVRAKQTQRGDTARDAVLPILIHGDAAFAGQGVVGETLNLSQLDGYKTGGTVHIVVNNQIGFTTLPMHARSSAYATDVARIIQAPIFHVNGDDPEAAIRVARLALDYRQVFNKDVVIDLVCYRQHGHNEGDEPSYTQPLMYDKIKGHRSVRKKYTETLLRRGDLDPEAAEQILDDFHAKLQQAFEETKNLSEEQDGEVAVRTDESPVSVAEGSVDTTVPREALEKTLRALVDLPEAFNVHPKLGRLIQRKDDQFEKGTMDWAFAEALAFGTLLQEGTPVRLSGQDSGRGTFSQRHAVLHDQEDASLYIPLNHIAEIAGDGEQAEFQVYDSLLSEYAALGFEYGYSVAAPEALVLWEAQFGDFVNGAQIMIDQFITAAEEKWGQSSSLVMLLPHGFEGQGPEHSSARLERFLQACAEDNIIVANFSTPANYFHALRRQMKRAVAKPLVVMTPKSLLRHPQAVATPEELADGQFQEVIPAATEPGSAKRLLFCSGKVYYDLLKAQGELENPAEVAIVRLEQFYPFPAEQVAAELERFGVGDVHWVQEEPKNMGAWSFLQPRFNDLLRTQHGDPCAEVGYVGRLPSASPATGSARVHAAEQRHIVQTALTVEG
ncbi:MAG: multifunctional oxoglutarate decarboxylase/oxoglutarate dehydrogenase thiamine pyrophosphate-binding subunit/dihydrolipoyllysine-residue succinyltransferase subunit [Bacteroidota bacterium]